MKRYVTLEKEVGETPLERLESWRAAHPKYADVPLAYAGRLDPMASGKLLILIGEECKRQHEYHGLDKEYEVEVLFGVHSDSGDVLGLIEEMGEPPVGVADRRRALRDLRGPITLPYPAFSAKTVQGKPLHTWAIEGRLAEIEIPTYTTTIYRINLEQLTNKTREEVFHEASQKIESIPPVTDPRKALGNDFRRPAIRDGWKQFVENGHPDDVFSIVTIRATVSSGTYMRTLAEKLAKACGTSGLAYSIYRRRIGRYQPLPFGLGVWLTEF